MNPVFIIFRVVHIFGSVLWVGGAIVYLFFVSPTVKSLGPDGGRFMQNFTGKAGFPRFMNSVSLATILSGALLFYSASGGMQAGWLTSGPGLGYTLGSLVGIGVFFVGFLLIRPRVDRMKALGGEIGANGGRPTPAQAAELVQLEREMGRIEWVDFIMLSIALLAMATARYWAF